jgi:ketosteroid isomerase-like protein
VPRRLSGARGDVELVERTFESLRRRAYADAARAFREDAVWQNTAAFPGPARCVGRDAIVEFWTGLIEDFDVRAGRQTVESAAWTSTATGKKHSTRRG